MSKIEITLSSANMGNVDEVDFDLWARFVAENVNEACGVDVASVDQRRFGDPGDDIVTGGKASQRDAIEDWLSHGGWAAFCGQGGPWETMRREHDAKKSAA